MEIKNILYAAYGSNMNLRQMARRCPGAKLVGVGELQNYELTFRGKRRGVANIERCDGSNVPVVLWKITNKCEKSLDYYEGFPRLYVKEQISVKYKNEIVQAMVYIMSGDYCNLPAKPEQYYLETIEQGYRENGIISSGLFDAVQNVKRQLVMSKIVKEEIKNGKSICCN